jgi:hypothetical protein
VFFEIFVKVELSFKKWNKLVGKQDFGGFALAAKSFSFPQN